MVRHIHKGTEKRRVHARAKTCWKDYGEQRSCLAAVCSKILFVRPLWIENCDQIRNWFWKWIIEELKAAGAEISNKPSGPYSRMQLDVRCSEANDNHPTSREKAINPTKEQPGTQSSNFQLEHFHAHPRMKMRRRSMVEGVHVTRRKVPFSECCGFWRVDQGVFISTRVHIWRQSKESRQKNI